MSGVDYVGYANSIQPLQEIASGVAALNSAKQAAAVNVAGPQAAAGNYLGAGKTLAASGAIPQGVAMQQLGYGVTGAQATAVRNYPAALAAAGSAGDQAGVQAAQAGQIQNQQIVGAYLKNALPAYQAAFQQHGAAGLANAVSMTGQDLARMGIIQQGDIPGVVNEAMQDPQGFMTGVGNLVQQTTYQKIGSNSVLATDPLGSPKSIITGSVQTTLPTPGGGGTLVNTPASIVPAQSAPAPTQAAGTPSAAPSTGTMPPGPSLPPGNVPGPFPSNLSAPSVGTAPLNNPGNLRPPGSSTGFMQFSTPQAGMVALSDDLAAKAKDGITTLGALANKYAPPGQNDTTAWEQTVGGVAGITDPNTKIDLANPNTRSAVLMGIVKAEGNAGTQLIGATPPATLAGVQVLASTATAGPLIRMATPSELTVTPYASAQINQATGALSNTVMKSDVDNLTPAAKQQLGEQYWLTGVMPDIGRGDAASLTKQDIINYATNKSNNLGLTGTADASRHNIVQSAQKQLSTMLGQQAEITASENNANDSAQQIMNLLPSAGAKYGFRTLNEFQQAYKRYSNDPDLAKLDEALTDFNGDFAKTQFSNANGSGGSGGVSDREDIKDLFNASDSIPVLQAKLQQAQVAMRFRSGEFGNAIQRLNMIATTGIVPTDPQAAALAGGSNPNPAVQRSPTLSLPTARAPAGSSVAPPPGAIQMLRANPQLAPQFNQKYGPNAAASILAAPIRPSPPPQQTAMRWLQPGALQ